MELWAAGVIMAFLIGTGEFLAAALVDALLSHA